MIENETHYIDSVEELIWFAEEVNSGNNFSGKTIHISGNIDLNNNTWTPIGNGHTLECSIEIVDCYIKNMKCNSLQSGLFGNINIKNLTVKNLSIGNATISVNEWDDHNIGLLAGTLRVSNNASISIQNSSFNGTLSNNHNFDDGNTGGIFGAVVCEGTNSTISIENTTVNSNITGANVVGGIIGHVNDSNLMNTFKFNRVVVDSEIYAANSYGYNDTFAGGLCGILNANKVFITQCTIKGSVYSNAYEGWCGGMAGRGEYNMLQMSDCCVNASIDSTFGGWYGTQHCGAGFLGFSQCNDNMNSFIKNSYFNGTVNSGVAFVTRDNNAGDTSIPIINCYFDTETTGLSAKMMHSYSNAGQLMTNVLSGCAGYTSEQVKNETNFIGWDFEKIWIMDSNAPRIRTNDELEESDKFDIIDFGTVRTGYKSDSLYVPLSIDWNLNALINIGSSEDESLKLLGILLSKDAYHGTDSMAEHMIQFGLLDKKENLLEGQDLNTNTGVCFYVSVNKVEKGDEEYYIVTAVSRGTTTKGLGIEWIYDLMYWKQFFKSRGDELYSGINKELKDMGLDIKDSRIRYFITGHSLGGAISNYLSNKLWKNGVDIDKIACYTYASPYTCHDSDDKMSDGHIYNYIGLKDVVPTVGQSTNDNRFEMGTHRFGNDRYMIYESNFIDIYNSIYYPKEWEHDGTIDWEAGTPAGNLDYTIKSGGEYHACDTYLAQILTDEVYVVFAFNR